MTRPTYFDAFENLAFKREGGILELKLHSDNDTIDWACGTPNKQLEQAFLEISRDIDNGVVIFTGAGKAFSGPEIARKVGPGLPQYSGRPWMTVFEEVHQLMSNMMAIPVPVIAAVNGPAVRHCELPMMADIVLITEDTVFQDSAHFTGGLVPGDGKHVIFPLLMGINRARHFMLTGKKLSSSEAMQIGLAQEVVPRGDILARAWKVAGELMEQPQSVRRYTRRLLTEKIRKELNENLSMGVALEGLGIWSVLSEE